MIGLDQPVILAIETATRAGGVSVSRGMRVVASRRGNPNSSHSTDLLENIDRALRDAGTELNALDCIAAAIGPGSFTGLRIGLATTKSLAVALHRNCASVSTLAAIAHQAGPSERTVALLPAGRGEVFAQMFTVRDEVAHALDEAKHLSPSEMIDMYGHYHRVLWAGAGAHAQRELLKTEAASRMIEIIEIADTSRPPTGSQPRWTLSPEFDNLSDAIARLAFQQWRSGALLSPEDLRANYVRPSDAEIKRKT